jgi:hypothetical protein
VNTSEDFKPHTNIFVVRTPGDATEFKFPEALLDTASPYTIFPENTLRCNNFLPTGIDKTIKVGGETLSTYKYALYASLKSHDSARFLTVLGWERDYILVGRDLMRFYRIEINFPSRKVQIYLS